MATTKSAFVQYVGAALVGTGTVAAGTVVAMNETSAKMLAANSATALRLDRPSADNLATAGFAKNGAAVVALTGTTPVTIDLTDLTSATASSAGDTTFATWYQMTFFNIGAADVTIASAASNGARLGFAGTTPTLTIPAGSYVTFQTVAGLAVDSTHKGITVTPTAGGSFSISVGGA